MEVNSCKSKIQMEKQKRIDKNYSLIYKPTNFYFSSSIKFIFLTKIMNINNRKNNVEEIKHKRCIFIIAY